MDSYETLPVSPIWGAENLICTRSSTPNHLNPWLLCFVHHPTTPPSLPKSEKKKKKVAK